MVAWTLAGSDSLTWKLRQAELPGSLARQIDQYLGRAALPCRLARKLGHLCLLFLISSGLLIVYMSGASTPEYKTNKPLKKKIHTQLHDS